MSDKIPEKIDLRIQEFASQIAGAPRMPIWIDINPLYPEIQCFLNCNEYVQRRPKAKIIFGWMFWESPISLEAEFHAIVSDEQGLKCITKPVIKGVKRLLFLPDKQREVIFQLTQENHLLIHSFRNHIYNIRPARPYTALIEPSEVVERQKSIIAMGKSRIKINPDISPVTFAELLEKR